MAKLPIVVGLGLRAFLLFFVILAPYFYLDRHAFGSYIVLYSSIQIATYVIDYGVSISTLRLAGANVRHFEKTRRILALKDIFLTIPVVLTAVFSFTAFVVMGTAWISSIWLSRLSFLRIHRGINSELLVLGITNVIAIAGALYCFYSGESDNVLLIFFLVLLPRALAACAYFFMGINDFHDSSIREWIKLIRKAATQLPGQFPYALQGVFIAATSNLDSIILAVEKVPLALVGDIKLLTTAVGGVLLPMDIIGQYKISLLSNRAATEAKKIQIHNMVASLERFLVTSLLALGAAISVVMYLFKGFSVIAAVIMEVSIYFRAQAMRYAASLTMSGDQKTRVVIQIISNFIYWGALAIGGWFTNEIMLFSSVVVPAILQYSMLKRALKR